jgi:EAL domain-containing protein (putative c-di-GMP-specific phosphodiesterase class I)
VKAKDRLLTTSSPKILRQLGCDSMQGYLFSAPLEPAEFERLLVSG